jgi:hypothetical protein
MSNTKTKQDYDPFNPSDSDNDDSLKYATKQNKNNDYKHHKRRSRSRSRSKDRRRRSRSKSNERKYKKYSSSSSNSQKDRYSHDKSKLKSTNDIKKEPDETKNFEIKQENKVSFLGEKSLSNIALELKKEKIEEDASNSQKDKYSSDKSPTNVIKKELEIHNNNNKCDEIKDAEIKQENKVSFLDEKSLSSITIEIKKEKTEEDTSLNASLKNETDAYEPENELLNNISHENRTHESIDNIHVNEKKSEAIKLNNKDKTKLLEGVKEIAKTTIKPYYISQKITKDDYKLIMKKVVDKVDQLISYLTHPLNLNDLNLIFIFLLLKVNELC